MRILKREGCENLLIKQTRFEQKMVESAGSLQAVALLIDELNSEDNKVRYSFLLTLFRLNSVRNIQTISIAIGPDRSRK